MKTIDQLERVDDLAEGEHAAPAAGMHYDLCPIGGKKIGTTVERVERRGADLYAISAAGSFRVTGRGGWVLCPSFVDDDGLAVARGVDGCRLDRHAHKEQNMDPNAALHDLIDILDALADERRNARYQAQQILGWISRGGFAPPVLPANLETIERLANSAGFARPSDMPPAQDPLTLRDLLNRIAHD